jgi:histidyl-tRNA synthetase
MPGVLELLPLEQTAFQKMVDAVRRVYELHGFVPIETPVLELSEVLLTKTGGETERQVYFAQSTGSLEQGRDPDLAMRFDLTVPLARYVAEHQNDLVFPFRRYQIQRVYRGEAPQRGRFREFYQADIDIVGLGELPVTADAECPAVIYDVFRELAIGAFTVKVNNRKLVQGVLSDLGVELVDHAGVLREIDKLDKRGADHVREALGGYGLSSAATAGLLDFVAYSSAGIESALRHLAVLGTPNELMAQGRSELITVFETLQGLGVDDGAIVLDCSIARGLDYYTGTVFETVLDDHPGIGSICSGGRYDDLAGMYTNTHLPRRAGSANS